jgi:predicted small metal-binding protein
MTKVLKCGDVVPGCDFEIRGNSEDEVLQQAAEHAKTGHGLENIPPEVTEKVRGAIHEEAEPMANAAGAS